MAALAGTVHDNGGAESLLGISMRTSMGVGRGCVSNTKGNPMTPITSKTAAPTTRRRARVMAWAGSDGDSA